MQILMSVTPVIMANGLKMQRQKIKIVANFLEDLGILMPLIQAVKKAVVVLLENTMSTISVAPQIGITEIA